MLPPKIPVKCQPLLREYRSRRDTYLRRRKTRELSQQAGEALIRVWKVWNLEVKAWQSLEAAKLALDACIEARHGDSSTVEPMPDPPPPKPEEPGPQPPPPDVTPSPDNGGGGGGGSAEGEGNGHAEPQAHVCGAACRTKLASCSRRTCNDGYCWQHAIA